MCICFSEVTFDFSWFNELNEEVGRRWNFPTSPCVLISKIEIFEFVIKDIVKFKYIFQAVNIISFNIIKIDHKMHYGKGSLTSKFNREMYFDLFCEDEKICVHLLNLCPNHNIRNSVGSWIEPCETLALTWNEIEAYILNTTFIIRFIKNYWIRTNICPLIS